MCRTDERGNSTKEEDEEEKLDDDVETKSDKDSP